MGIKSFLKTRTGLLITLGVLILLVGIVWFSINFSSNNRLITGVEIRIAPDTGVYFMNQQDVNNILQKTIGSPTGKSLGEINLTQIETTFKKLPYVQSAQVFAGLDGKLKINIQQRIPILRVINAAGETFFLDTAGNKIPHRGHFAPDVLIASGNIQEKLGDSGRIKTAVLRELLNTAKQIAADSFWNAQFEQCYVDNFGDIVLVPRVGRHSIVTGSSENLPEKLENLRVFYEKGLRNLGWEKYKTIDLRYRGQVIGVKDGKET